MDPFSRNRMSRTLSLPFINFEEEIHRENSKKEEKLTDYAEDHKSEKKNSKDILDEIT